MRVLITGAAGFIGSHLADRFVADGHLIAGIDNLTTGRLGNFAFDGNPTLWVGDICDRSDFYRFANDVQPDVVIHCAASYSDANLWHRDTDTNIGGTINAVNVARHHRAQLVYFQTALPPVSSYAISKLAGEQYIALSGVPALVFRLANVYGPRNLSGPIPTFYKRLSAGQPCTVADTRRDMVYVKDLVDGVLAALAAGVSGCFDICSGETVPIGVLYAAVAGELGVEAEARRVPRGEDDVASMILDPAAALAAFGWRPVTRLADGVRAAVGWYREHGVDRTYTHLKVAS